jgi:hypothetical protein
LVLIISLQLARVNPLGLGFVGTVKLCIPPPEIFDVGVEGPVGVEELAGVAEEDPKRTLPITV